MRIALLAALLVASTQTAALAGTTGTLRGIIVDQVTGVPVAGAAVSVESPSHVERTVTDARGSYCFVSLVPDTYALSVELRGYEPIRYAGIRTEAGSVVALNVLLRREEKVLIRDFVQNNAFAQWGGKRNTSDLYRLNRSATPFWSTANTLASLLVTVPGVQIGGGAPPAH